MCPKSRGSRKRLIVDGAKALGNSSSGHTGMKPWSAVFSRLLKWVAVQPKATKGVQGQTSSSQSQPQTGKGMWPDAWLVHDGAREERRAGAAAESKRVLMLTGAACQSLRGEEEASLHESPFHVHVMSCHTWLPWREWSNVDVPAQEAELKPTSRFTAPQAWYRR